MKIGMLIFYLAYVAVGVISFGVAVKTFLDERAFLARADLVTGTIASYRVDSSGNAVVFCPVIKFTTEAGKPISYEGEACQNHPDQIQIGQPVQVYYDPQDTRHIELKSGFQYGGAAFAVLFGVIFLFAGALIFVRNWVVDARRKRAASAITIQPPARPSAYMPPPTSSVSDSEAGLLAQEASLKAQTEKLKAAEAELQRKIEEKRRQKGQ